MIAGNVNFCRAINTPTYYNEPAQNNRAGSLYEPVD
jgi:hypothetical protein